jgi:hypothetical protein
VMQSKISFFVPNLFENLLITLLDQTRGQTDTSPLCINFMRFFSKNVTKEAPGKNVIFVFHVYNIFFQSLI